MAYELHDSFRDRLALLPLSAGARGMAAMVLVEIVRWSPEHSDRCSKTTGELGTLLNLRPGEMRGALRALADLGMIEPVAEGGGAAITLLPVAAQKPPEKLRVEIAEAVACHAAWKRHLRHIIDAGISDVQVDEVASDHLCDFGRWLYGPDFSEADKDVDYEMVRTLHAQFHRVAAATIQLAVSGRKADAEHCMNVGGVFTRASLRLTKALASWRRTSTR